MTEAKSIMLNSPRVGALLAEIRLPHAVFHETAHGWRIVVPADFRTRGSVLTPAMLHRLDPSLKYAHAHLLFEFVHAAKHHQRGALLAADRPGKLAHHDMAKLYARAFRTLGAGPLRCAAAYATALLSLLWRDLDETPSTRPSFSRPAAGRALPATGRAARKEACPTRFSASGCTTPSSAAGQA